MLIYLDAYWLTISISSLLFTSPATFSVKQRILFIIKILVSIIYADPVQPQNHTVKREFDKITLQWSSKGHVEYYNVSAHCQHYPTPNISHLGNETTARIIGLMPGTHCSASIIGVSGGLQSSPLTYTDIETIEKGNANEFPLTVNSEFSFI